MRVQHLYTAEAAIRGSACRFNIGQCFAIFEDARRLPREINHG
jgi:hypothetical protein